MQILANTHTHPHTHKHIETHKQTNKQYTDTHCHLPQTTGGRHNKSFYDIHVRSEKLLLHRAFTPGRCAQEVATRLFFCQTITFQRNSVYTPYLNADTQLPITNLARTRLTQFQ